MDFSNLKVLVVGEMCLDIIEKGNSYRLSPEAPVPVILNPSKQYSLGMAGNTAVNLVNLGADVRICSWFKKDEDGEKILELLNANNIKHTPRPYNVTDSEYYSKDNIVLKRIIANNQQVARVDVVNYDIATKAFLRHLENTFDVYETNQFDLIIISDYNKGFINDKTWPIMRPVLEKYNKGNFFVDTKKLNVTDFYEGMYIFPNRKEMDALLEFNNCKNRNQLREEMNLDFIIETASEEGAFLYKNDGKIVHCPAYNTDFNSIYGAGDIFIGAFALYYTKFQSKIKALEFANYCCSKAVMKKDRCHTNINEVKDFIKGAY